MKSVPAILFLPRITEGTQYVPYRVVAFQMMPHGHFRMDDVVILPAFFMLNNVAFLFKTLDNLLHSPLT